ncbi:restriction endonuclease subunit S [Marinifilum flexuosum]|uniref:Type I restriction enzyme S subunit n=1 Tax=Marinifilum flexuosum TaxID=1117708 RepID=A0A419WTC6_9BACT|nr:restriction endonuclease subunit S [Marinifilum flexuosum]RKD98721.1 type I restriction enzyme S subunit [Marinifilum flexuosum]
MKLLEHFKELSIYPQNAKELKGLILQLAIQGKLTAQWRNTVGTRHGVSANNNAKALLEQIKAEKAQLIKDKKIKKEKALPPISQEEIPFELPESWEWEKIGNVIIQIKGGGTPSKNNQKYWNGDLPWASVKDLKQGKYIESTIDYISNEGLNNSSSNLIPIGNLIICTRMGLGKICINKIPITINQDLKALTLPDQIENDFFYNYYNTLNIKGTGVTVAGIKQSELLNFLIPIPPLAEQKAIVQIVDTLFKEVEALENLTQKRVQLKEDFITSALHRLSEGEVEKEWAFLQEHFSTFMTEESNVKKLRECILQLAVQGKLTKQWRNTVGTRHGVSADNNAKSLLAQIQAEKAQLIKEKKIKKEKALPPITQEEIPYELPEGWEWCRLGLITEFISSGSRDWAKYYSSRGAKFVTMGNLSSNSFKLRLDKMRYVSPPKNGEGTRTKLQHWDFLLSITGDVGNLGLIPENFGEAYINQHTAVVRMMERLRSLYIGYYFLSPLTKKQFNEPQRGIKNSFRLSDIQLLFFPLPPLAEQKAIVTKVNELMALCDTLEQEIAKNKEAATKLMQSVLREVFQGKPKEQEELLLAAEPKAEYK